MGDASGDRASRAPVRLWRWTSFCVLPFLLALSGTVAIAAAVQLRHGSGNAVPAGSDPLAELMQLAPLSPQPAPHFVLTDQHGRRVGLAQFRGKAVLLAFLDARCTEACPVIAEELLVSKGDLGRDARRVAFVGVNVNPLAASVADVAHFSALHGLSHLPNWSFLTGSTAQLREVWRAYGIRVDLPRHATQTIHADYLFFLDPRGNERFLATPSVLERPNGTGYLPPDTVRRWGEGIATYLRESLAS